MINYILIILLSSLNLYGGILLYEDDEIKYSLPDGWQKRAGDDGHRYKYIDGNGRALIIQLFRHRKWSQWHMKGLFKARETFQKYYDQSNGGPSGDTLEDIAYDADEFILSLTWCRSDQSYFVSKLKLTSFGCVGFHMPCTKQELVESAEFLNQRMSGLIIPEKIAFVPEDITSEILDEMGGAVAFIFISVFYLMFSLFKRSQLRNRRLERRLEEESVKRLT
jgi:hypothetical protein